MQRRPGPGRDNRRALTIVIGAAVIIGLIVAGGSIFSRVNRAETSFKYGWPFLLIGLAVGLGVGAVVIIAARQAGVRPTRLELAAILVVCGAVGALIGLAFAPPKVDPDDVSPLPKAEQRRRSEMYGDLPEGSKAGPLDLDGDGVPDLDENGRPRIGLDTDGDGVYDSILEPCPEGSPTPKPRSGDTIEVSLIRPDVPLSATEDGQIIDAECDGEIDAVVPYSDEFLNPPNGGFDFDGESEAAPNLPAPPPTISPRERAAEADQQSSASGGQILKIIGIGLGVLALVALAAWLIVQWRQREHETDDDSDQIEPEPDLGLPPPAAPNPNFQRSIEELIDDPDPRNGILAAYGRLLIGFDEIGLGRLPHEGPQEHLDRALGESSADPVAANELTTWFTLARFSDHPITEDDRRQAVEALRRVTATIRPQPVAAPIAVPT